MGKWEQLIQVKGKTDGFFNSDPITLHVWLCSTWAVWESGVETVNWILEVDRSSKNLPMNCLVSRVNEHVNLGDRFWTGIFLKQTLLKIGMKTRKWEKMHFDSNRALGVHHFWGKDRELYGQEIQRSRDQQRLCALIELWRVEQFPHAGQTKQPNIIWWVKVDGWFTLLWQILMWSAFWTLWRW